jgi:signal transduction histidine kinase
MAEHLRIATQLLRRLGEELNPHPDQGIVELVRNSYDAAAVECTVDLADVESPGGTIRVVDDGEGMTRDDIRNGWLVLGFSRKAGQERTRKGRIRIGSKGIGRLAALRLGQTVKLITRPRSEPKIQHVVNLEWQEFDRAAIVDDVPITIQTKPRGPDRRHGTEIEISDLNRSLGAADVRRLARTMILLADPFAHLHDGKVAGFRPVLQAAQFKELERLVADGYFRDADFHLVATLNESGRAKATVRDPAGHLIFKADHSELSGGPNHEPYAAPAATFEFWSFLLGGGSKRFVPRFATLSELRNWLKDLGGIHLFHRGMRVSPYSDFDWLDINRSRVADPEDRPGTNNSIGRLSVPDEDGQLVQKTDRVGFIENDAFAELRRFATDALDWMHQERVRESQKRRQSTKVKTKKRVAVAKRSLRNAIRSVPAGVRKQIEHALDSFERAQDRQEATLRGDLQLYRTLCTVGAASATFAHQTKSPIVQIIRGAKTLEGELPDVIRGDVARTLVKVASGIRIQAESLLTFSHVPISLLEHEKRRRGDVPLHDVVGDVEKLMSPFLNLRHAKILTELEASDDTVVGSRAAIEAILTNLILNSLQAFTSGSPGERRILIRTRNVAPWLELIVSDSGPGISLAIDDIWLPGKTTTATGTGLGLTIVQDVILEMRGRIKALARGELGGAEFIMFFPGRKE